jgi:hypothetical protein
MRTRREKMLRTVVAGHALAYVEAYKSGASDEQVVATLDALLGRALELRDLYAAMRLIEGRSALSLVSPKVGRS